MQEKLLFIGVLKKERRIKSYFYQLFIGEEFLKFFIYDAQNWCSVDIFSCKFTNFSVRCLNCIYNYLKLSTKKL